MKAVSLALTSALAVSLCGSFAFSQEAPQPAPSQAQPAKSITRIKQGGQIQSRLITNAVDPIYPQEAKDKHIQGKVRLHAIISKDGSVGQLELMSGHPLLAKAALEAVRQWKYKPTLLNGEPVEVDTTIDLIFALS